MQFIPWPTFTVPSCHCVWSGIAGRTFTILATVTDNCCHKSDVFVLGDVHWTVTAIDVRCNESTCLRHAVSLSWSPRCLATVNCDPLGPFNSRHSIMNTRPISQTLDWLLWKSTVFSARCNIYISRLSYDVSVRLSVRLSLTKVRWRIIANLGFKFRSKFTAHCFRGERQSKQHLALC